MTLNWKVAMLLVAVIVMATACAIEAEGVKKADGTASVTMRAVLDPHGTFRPENTPWGTGRTASGVNFALYDTDNDGNPDLAVNQATKDAYKITKLQVVNGQVSGGEAEIEIHENPISEPLTKPIDVGQTASELLAARNLSSQIIASLQQGAVHEAEIVSFHAFDSVSELVKLSVHWSTALEIPDFRDFPTVQYQMKAIFDPTGNAHAFLNICLEGSLTDVAKVLVDMGFLTIKTKDAAGIEVGLSYEPTSQVLTITYGGVVVDSRVL